MSASPARAEAAGVPGTTAAGAAPAAGATTRRSAGTTPAPEPATASVDPDRLLRRLEWTVLRRLDGVLQGDYRTLFRGFGLDLADLREYQLHDDVRYIDWNVTARMQVPHVREFQEDREVAAWFLVDLSGSLDFGSVGRRKRSLAVEFVAVIARVLTRHGNRAGAVLLTDHGEDVIPPRNGRRHVLHLLDRMLVPSGHSPPSPRGRAGPGRAARPAALTDLADLLARSAPTIKRRCVVFVVSDFISTPGWGPRLAGLARRHDVVAVRLSDPMERALPDLGMVVMQDAETGEQLLVDTHDPRVRQRFAAAAGRREAALRDTLADAGVDGLELDTDEPLDSALLRFTRLRKRRSQLAAGGIPRQAPQP